MKELSRCGWLRKNMHFDAGPVIILYNIRLVYYNRTCRDQIKYITTHNYINRDITVFCRVGLFHKRAYYICVVLGISSSLRGTFIFFFIRDIRPFKGTKGSKFSLLFSFIHWFRFSQREKFLPPINGELSSFICNNSLN